MFGLSKLLKPKIKSTSALSGMRDKMHGIGMVRAFKDQVNAKTGMCLDPYEMLVSQFLSRLEQISYNEHEDIATHAQSIAQSLFDDLEELRSKKLLRDLQPPQYWMLAHNLIHNSGAAHITSGDGEEFLSSKFFEAFEQIVENHEKSNTPTEGKEHV